MVNTIILTFFAISAEAASFDGIYDYHYTLNGPNGREYYDVKSGFIVSGGQISSNPSFLTGTVDSSGNVNFKGTSPYGGSTATFTGALYLDGTGKGNYRDGQGLVGTWNVVRVSGGSVGFDSIGSIFLGIVRTMLGVMYGLSFIGEAVGFSGQAAAIAGTTVVIFSGVVMFTLLSEFGHGRKKGFISKTDYDPNRHGEYTASPTGEPSRTQGVPATTIEVAPTPLNPPIGLHVERPALPDRFDVRAFWDKEGVDLQWDILQFDPEKYMLDRYEIIWQFYDGTNTSPISGNPINVSPNSTSWGGSFEQTYRWNTQGDIDGIRVNAVFRDLSPDVPNRFVRISDTVHPPIR